MPRENTPQDKLHSLSPLREPMNRSHSEVRRSGLLPGLLPRKLLPALVVVGVLMTTALGQTRERVLVCPFEGPRAAQLRWRVSAVVKKARHTSVRYRPPPYDASDARLVRYARRRIIDAFIFGDVEQDDDDGSWTLRLTVKGPDAEILGEPLVYRGRTLGKLVKELKREGKIDLREAVLPYADDEPEEKDESDEDEFPSSTPEAPESADDDGETGFDIDSNAGRSKVDSSERNVDDLLAPPEGYDEPAGSITDDDLEEESTEATSDSAQKTAKKKKSGKSRLQAFLGMAAASKNSKKKKNASAASNDWDDDDSSGGLIDPLLASSDDLLVADVAYSPSDKRMPLMRFGIGGGLVARELLYVDNLYGRLRNQSAAAWVYRVEAELFPFAPPLNDRVSLVGGFESNLAGTVNDAATGDDYGVNFSEYFGGLRIVQPVGKHALRGQLTIGNMTAGLDDPDNNLSTPEFGYSLVRASLAGILNLGSISLQAHAGYQMPLGYGEVGEDSWFPRIEGDGFETGATISYPLSGKVTLAVGTSLRRMNLDMNAEPEDALLGSAEVAGGATDTYISGRAGLTISL